MPLKDFPMCHQKDNASMPLVIKAVASSRSEIHKGHWVQQLVLKWVKPSHKT